MKLFRFLFAALLAAAMFAPIAGCEFKLPGTSEDTYVYNHNGDGDDNNSNDGDDDNDNSNEENHQQYR